LSAKCDLRRTALTRNLLPLTKGERDKKGFSVAKIEIDFEWPVAERYEIVRPKSKGTTSLTAGLNEPRLEAYGKTETRRPLELKPGGRDAYLWVAQQKPTIEAYQIFARAFGLLGGEFDPSEGALSKWQETIEGLHTLRSWSKSVRSDSLFSDLGAQSLRVGSQLNVIVRPRSDGTPVLAFQPTSLRSALTLQCAQAIISGAEIRDCEQCGQWFAAGGEGGKRAHAQFCSVGCKIKFKNDRNRARAKEITK
jgi:hypothetical protein